MNSNEIENIITGKEKELKQQLNDLSTIEQEKLYLQRQILEIQLQKKDLEQAIEKAKNTASQTKIELSLLTKQFWSEKRGGN
jgi:predicted  nucleic acid-binding Zn-ribbon protein